MQSNIRVPLGAPFREGPAWDETPEVSFFVEGDPDPVDSLPGGAYLCQLQADCNQFEVEALVRALGGTP